MEPEHLNFGGGVSHTVLNPLVAAMILVAGIAILLRPRSQALTGFLVASLLIPVDQVLLIGPAHFPMMRILILFGLFRVVRDGFGSGSGKKVFSGGFNAIDKSLIALTVITSISGVLLFPETGALIYQAGNLFTVVGAYCVLRSLIRDENDVQQSIRVFAYLAVFIAAIMVYERVVGWNPYALLGGARSYVYGSIMARDDKFRAMGCFNHPILAGTFGAILVPMFVGMWWRNKKNLAIASVGVIAATVITVASNSSTPMLAYMAGVLGLCLWPARRWMRVIRWGLVFTLVSLHIVMKAPVWHLISRIDLAGGSSSYHRFQLVNQCILHFSDWWLIGVKNPGDWGWDMWDLSNQYVMLADTAGLLPLICFLALLVYGFKYLGRARKAAHGDKASALLAWSMSASLFANIVAFFGIFYFDQTQIVWYAFLAMIAAVSVNVPVRQATSAKLEAAAPNRLGNAWEPAPQVANESPALTRIWG